MEIPKSITPPWDTRQNDVTTVGRLQIRLFGGFELLQNGLPLPRTRTRTERWLLALLVLRANQPVERAWLAGTFWPETTPDQALNNLRRSLSNLRQVLGDEAYRLLSPTSSTITFDMAGVFCDVAAFDAACSRSDSASLREATALYRGPLLPECDADWLSGERENREQACIKAWESLAAQARQEGKGQDAVDALRQVVRLDPYREPAQCALMEALAAQGDRAGMTVAYRQFRLLLHEELQSEPSAETKALYLRLREEKEPRQSGKALPDPSAPSLSPVRAASRPLPRPLSTLVGRQEESVEVASLLARARCVTLTGTGGVGKTRLALNVAAHMVSEFRDGIWFVDLAPVTAETAVADVIAATLELREEPGQSQSEALHRFVAEREMLLVLDNCEHLVNACATLTTTLLQNAPDLRILATSRQPLGVSGEQAWRVPSLSLPERVATSRQGSPDILLEWTATRLFIERAQETSASFTLTSHNAPFVIEICRRLDGIPLAIELAAARVKALSVEQIAQRLQDAFRLLTGGAHSALPRQQTLRGLLDWSYTLLTPAEQTLLTTLSAFADGWTLEAAEAVSGAEEALSPSSAYAPSEDILDLMQALVEKSLVTMHELENEGVRYRLLETVRQYAQEKLRESGRWENVHRGHYAYFMKLLAQAREELSGPLQPFWLQRLEQEKDNCRAAFDYCLRSPAPSESEGETSGIRALRLGIALHRFWGMRGHYLEGRDRLRTALERPDTQAVSQERSDALNALGLLCAKQSDMTAARCYQEEALAIQKARGDAPGIAHTAGFLGGIAYRAGDYAAATGLFLEALQFCEATNDRRNAGSLRSNLGLIAMEQNDWERARLCYEECLALSREVEDRHLIAGTLCNLGIVAAHSDPSAGIAYYRQALEMQRALEDQSGIARTLSNMGDLALQTGDREAGSRYLLDSLARYAALGEKQGMAYVLTTLASSAHDQGQSERCVQLLGAEANLRQAGGFSRVAVTDEWEEKALAELRAAHGDVLVDAWYTSGRMLSQEEVVRLAGQLPTTQNEKI